jgi:MYXO-CTERM domain-containing protein
MQTTHSFPRSLVERSASRGHVRALSRVAMLAAWAMAIGPAPAEAQVVYHVDFEDGTIDADVGSSRSELTDGGEITSAPNPDPDARNDSSMVGRMAIPASGRTRAELASQRTPTEGQTYRYRWSYYVPEGFFEGVDFNWLAMSQWKTWPCEVCNEEYEPAICGGCGGIFNEIGVRDAQWNFRWRAEPDCEELRQDIAVGQWTRFEMWVYWTTDTDGYVRLFRDGERIEAFDGIRTLFTSFETGTCDMYWALGLYASWSGADERVIYLDDIEIAEVTGPPPEDGGSPTMDGGAASDEDAGSSPDDGGAADDEDAGEDTSDGGDGDGSGGGCGCSIAGASDRGLWFALAFAGALMSRRRRKSIPR